MSAAVRVVNTPPPISNTSTLKYKWASNNGWTSGFFPALLWYLYEYSFSPSSPPPSKLKMAANCFTKGREVEKYNTATHDVGFMVYLPFHNGLKYWGGNKTFDKVIFTAAHSLATRYNKKVGLTRSWGSRDNMTSFEVIIDNLMNIELLFYASNKTNNSTLYDMAFSHASNTGKYWVREDGSTPHLCIFDPVTGKLISNPCTGTPQGYSTNSTWSRGQAWAIYGFTMVYRYTKDVKFLTYASKVANYYLRNSGPDMVPLWDFAVPKQSPEAFSDTSAAAIVGSGLIELYKYTKNSTYLDAAYQIIHSLLQAKYLGDPKITPAVLRKNRHDCKITNCTIIESDYYFLESLVRLSDYNNEFKERNNKKDNSKYDGVPIDYNDNNVKDIDTLRQRFVSAMLPQSTTYNKKEMEKICIAARKYTLSIDQKSGRWSDINYNTTVTNNERSWWNTSIHLQRMLILATRARILQEDNNNNTSECADNFRLKSLSASLKATEHWVEMNYTNTNWWWNQFGTPHALMKTLLLLGCSSTRKNPPLYSICTDKRAKLIAHAKSQHQTGTNLVWTSMMKIFQQLVWDCSSNNIKDCVVLQESFALIWSTATVQNQSSDGLMMDGSWHQHGFKNRRILYSGWGYGSIWSQQILALLPMVYHLPLPRPSKEQVDGISSMILDGQARMQWSGTYDHAVCGRLMTYFGNETKTQVHLNLGHYHYFAAFFDYNSAFPDFYNNSNTPLVIPYAKYLNSSIILSYFPRAKEFVEYQNILKGNTDNSIIGTKVYYTSDYVTHRTSSFMVTVRMNSIRTWRTECDNEENKQGKNIADGSSFLFVNKGEGGENDDVNFKDIFPVWHWKRIPGTVKLDNPGTFTCAETNDGGHDPASEFAGGLSGSLNGLAAYEQFGSQRMYTLRRSWFFLGDYVFSFTAGVLSQHANVQLENLTYTFDQRLLNGNVYWGNNNGEIFEIEKNSQNVSKCKNLSWVFHNTIIYGWLHGNDENREVLVSAMEQSGSWYDITQGDRDMIKKDVFSAYVRLNNNLNFATFATLATNVNGVSKIILFLKIINQ